MYEEDLFDAFVPTAEAARRLGLDEEILVERMSQVFGIEWIDERGYVPKSRLTLEYAVRLWIRTMCRTGDFPQQASD